VSTSEVYAAAIRKAIERGVRIGIEVAADCLRGAGDAHRLMGRPDVAREFYATAEAIGPTVEAVLLGTPPTVPTAPASAEQEGRP
jgi:SRSO17 transposase